RLTDRSWMLYVHCLIHGGLVYLFAPSWNLWIIPLLVFITHYIIGLWKLNQPEGIVYFIIDQFLHILILFGLWCMFVAPAGWLPQKWQIFHHSQAIWAVATGYLLVTFPLSLFLARATQQWRIQAEESGMRSAISLNEAGKWIG